MMDGQLGTILRAAREKKGVTIAQAEQATRIRQKYLTALENEDFDHLPEPVFVKGFLRNYALYLGLQPDDVLELYRQTTGVPAAPPALTPQIKEIQQPTRITSGIVSITIVVLAFLGVMGYLYRQYITPPPIPTPTIPIEIPTPTETPAVVATRVPPPTDVSVPDVVGLDLQKAEDTLKSVGLKIEVVERRYNSSIPAGVILSQTVPANSKVKPGAVIGVVLSRGIQQQTVPNVVGLAEADGTARLNAAGFKVERTTATGGTPGTILQQEPAAGSPLAPGGTVRIVVSAGDQVQVPNVIGLPLEDAKARLIQAGLTIGQIDFQGRNRLPPSELGKVCVNCVLSTDPPVGRFVPRGTVVIIGVRSE